jgi:MraZ protein
VLFTGTYEHSIDAKQRLAIPSEVRNRIKPDRDGEALYAVIGPGGTLCLYTERGFEKRAEQLDESEAPPDEVLEYERMFYSLAQRVELDKQGRVRLPEHLLRLTELGNQVVLLGVKDRLEIRDRDQWIAERAEMLKRPEMWSNPRQWMRRQSARNENASDL